MSPNDQTKPQTNRLSQLTHKPRVFADRGCRVKNKDGYLYDEELEEFLFSLPKVELHVHLDGSFEHDILYRHLLWKGISCLPKHATLPWDESLFPVRHLVEETLLDGERPQQKFQSLCICRGKRSLQEMIKCFEVFLPIVRGDLEFIEHLSCDFVKRQADQNIKYTEVRYSPHLLAQGGSFHPEDMVVDARSVVDAVTRGLRSGERLCHGKVRVNQILCCITWRPDWADDVVEICIERRHQTPCAVVGIDIAAGEEHFDSKKYPHLHSPHVDALTRAKEMGLNITVHAGEVDNTGEHVLDAIQKYHATRIGHGYRVARLISSTSSEEDEASRRRTTILEELIRRQVHFEACPTSSEETGGWDYRGKKNWEEHPLVCLIKNGLHVGINSDDPAVFDTSLTFQYRIAAKKMKLRYADLVQTVQNAIDASFADASIKEELQQELTRFCDQHEHLLVDPN